MFLYTSGSTGRPKGVVLSHYLASLGDEPARRAGPAPPGQRSLVAAPLYHMNGLAIVPDDASARATPSCCCRSSPPRATSRPPPSIQRGLPHLGADHDRHDAARARAAGRAATSPPVEAVRMGSAPVTQALIDQVRAVFPKAADQPTATARPRPGPWCSARIPRASRSPSCRPAIRIPRSSCAWCATARWSRDERRARDEVRRADDALSQAARGHGQGDDAGRLLPHRRRVPPRRRTASSSSSAAPTTCSCAAARTSIPARSRRCWRRHPGIHQAAVIPVPDELKGHKPIAFVVERAGRRARRAGGEELCAGQRAGLPASAPRAASSTRCRSPAPTRSTSACSPSRSQPEENLEMKAAVVREHGGPDRLNLRAELPRSQARRGRRDRGGEGLPRSTTTTCSRAAACPASRCRCRRSWASTSRARSPRSGPA